MQNKPYLIELICKFQRQTKKQKKERNRFAQQMCEQSSFSRCGESWRHLAKLEQKCGY